MNCNFLGSQMKLNVIDAVEGKLLVFFENGLYDVEYVADFKPFSFLRRGLKKPEADALIRKYTKEAQR